MSAALARALAARAAAVVQTTAFRRRALQVAVQSAAKRFRRGFIPRQLNLPALAGKSLSAIPQREWTIFAEASLVELGGILLNIASHVDLKKYKKHPRGQKKSPMEKTQFQGHPHVSTAKLLKGITPKVVAGKAA